MQPETLIQNANLKFAWGTVDVKGGARNKGSKNWSSKMVKAPDKDKPDVKHAYYEITWEVPVKGEPVIVVSGYRIKTDPGIPDESQDNSFSVRLSEKGFEVHSFDVGNSSEKGTRQAAAFSFIAIWGG